MSNWKPLIPPLIGLLIIVYLFFSPGFQQLVTTSPSIATGIIAVLSSIVGGLITIIATIIQTGAADRSSIRELDHASKERKTIRAEALIDEQFSQIKTGYDLIGQAFQKVRMHIVNLQRNYRTDLSPQEMHSFHPVLDLQADSMYVFASHIIALKNKELRNSWGSMVNQLDAILDIYNSIDIFFSQYVTLPIGQRQSVFPDQATMDKLLKIHKDFLDAAAKFLAVLYKLRQQKG